MYVPDHSLLRGLPLRAAEKFGKPCVGAHYAGRGVRANRLDADARCAVCGATATNSHHEPPVGMGGRNARFTLHGTELRPALIALCGSGTTGCHGMVHGGLLRIEWEWDDDRHAAAWWRGDLLGMGDGLYEMGAWAVYGRGGLIKTIRR